jgi:hypothetical protein
MPNSFEQPQLLFVSWPYPAIVDGDRFSSSLAKKGKRSHQFHKQFAGLDRVASYITIAHWSVLPIINHCFLRSSGKKDGAKEDTDTRQQRALGT